MRLLYLYIPRSNIDFILLLAVIHNKTIIPKTGRFNVPGETSKGPQPAKNGIVVQEIFLFWEGGLMATS